MRVVSGSARHSESPVSIEHLVLGQLMLLRMKLIRSQRICPLTAPIIVAAGIHFDDYLDQKQYQSGSNNTSKSLVDSQEKKKLKIKQSIMALITARVEIGVLMF